MIELLDIPRRAEWKVLICGDRRWNDKKIIHKLLMGLAQMNALVTVIEGCAKGADRVACVYDDPRFVHEHYPADWEKHGKAAGPIRNLKMLNDGKPDLVVAFHDDLENSKGTKHMVSIAQKAGIPTYLVSHD